MKKFIKIILISLVVIVVAAIAIPFLVPLDAYKNQIITQVKEKTGRDLKIEGSIKASIFPVLGVHIGKTSLSNPTGYTAANMIQADEIAVEVSLNALLNKQLKIQQFVLTKPLVNLEVNNNGKPNWEFGEETSVNQRENTNKNEEADKKENNGAGALLAGLTLGDIKITDGDINYNDNKTKKNISVKALNLKASLPSLKEKFLADGNVIWNGEKVVIKVSIANPNEIVDGKKSAFEFALKAAPVSVNYAGEASQKSASGNVDLNIPSIPALTKWVGSAFEWKGSTPLAFSVIGKLDGSATSILLDNAEISLDSTKFKGNIKAKLDEKIPDIEVKLLADALDLNPYIKQSPAKTSWLINSAVAAELSNQHIDLSGLNTANAKVHLILGSILYEKVKLGKTVINADLNNGELKLNIPEMALYGGNAKISSALNSSGTFSKNLNISNVNAGELLGDLSAQNKFTGTMNTSASLTGKLTSVQGAINSLNGSGNIKFSDGTIKGIDLKNMVNNIKSAFTNSETSQTAFSELSGTFIITNGLISNNDLNLKSQLLKLSGKGTVNLPKQTINYHLNPEVVSTVKRGDGSDTKGIEVPIIIEGSLDNPRFVPDLAGMVKNTIENPNALKNTVKSLKEQLKSGKPDINQVQDFLKGFGQ